MFRCFNLHTDQQNSPNQTHFIEILKFVHKKKNRRMQDG